MPKSKTKINPVSIERVKQVINESGMTQKDFAKKVLFYEQQTLSKIVNGKAPLTRESAARIAQYFKDINAAWLMGESDCKTKHEQEFYDFYADLCGEIQKEDEAWQTILDSCSCGFSLFEKSFKLYLHSMGYTLDYLRPPVEEGVVRYSIVDTEGNLCMVLTVQEEAEIVREIADFAEFKIKKLIEGSKADG